MGTKFLVGLVNFEKAVLIPNSQDTEESCQQFFIRNFFITQCALQVNIDEMQQ